MKAIHNNFLQPNTTTGVVYDPAKLVKMKAIHNTGAMSTIPRDVVYDPAKLVKMKAIHNTEEVKQLSSQLFMTLQS